MSLRVLFLGAGATGGYFGAHLLQAKKQGAAIDVAFLVREKRAQQLASDGLRIIGSEGDDQCYEAPFISVKNNNKTDPWDIIILTCKAYDLPSAIETIRPYIEEKTVVLPLLNGVAHFPILEKELGIEKILAGNCHINVALRDDGAIVQMTKLVRITYGLYRDHATSSDAFARGQAVLTQLHKVFQTCPIDARFSNHIMQDIWEKYLFLASLAGLTCLMRGSIGAIMASQEGEAIALEF